MKYFIILCVVVGVVHGSYELKKLTDVTPEENGVIQTKYGDDTSAYTPAQRKEKCAAANEYIEKQFGANNPLTNEIPSKTFPLLLSSDEKFKIWDNVTGFMCFAERQFVLQEKGENTTLYAGEQEVEYGMPRGVEIEA